MKEGDSSRDASGSSGGIWGNIRALFGDTPEPTLRVELLSLERRVRSGGREVVDHRPGAHDDLANCVALAAWHRRIPGYQIKAGHEKLEFPPGLRFVKDLTLRWPTS